MRRYGRNADATGRFMAGFRQGHEDRQRGRARQLCESPRGARPPVTKSDDHPYYHGYKSATTTERSGGPALRRYREKHRSRAHAANPRGIYAESGLGPNDYVLHEHRGRVYVDRVDRGGTHTTIGPTRGYSGAREAMRAAANDVHVRGVRVRRHQEPGIYNSELTQLGIVGVRGEPEEWLDAGAMVVRSRQHQPNVDRSAYDFFRQAAGGAVGHSSETAVHLARAEEEAQERGWEMRLDPSVGADVSWMDEDQLRGLEDGRIEIWDAVMFDESGEVVASLGEIVVDGTAVGGDPYLRVVEAELALEGLTEQGWQP